MLMAVALVAAPVTPFSTSIQNLATKSPATPALHPLAKTASSTPTRLHLVPDVSSLIAYTNDPVGDILAEIKPAYLAATLVAIGAVGVTFAQLLPSIGAAAFVLTEEEEAAVNAVANAYDAADWEKEDTEQGTKGYVNRRRQANEAKDAYQEGKSNREIRDSSLRYAETNLDFLAVLMRAAGVQRGQVFVDVGSGCGRTTLGAAALYPSLGKCTGVEFLPELVKMSNGYRGKVKGRKASTDFVSGDFTDPAVQSRLFGKADIVFASATYFNKNELEVALEDTLKVGSKVIMVDQRLRGSAFKLLEEVNDAAGDLQLNTGYVYEKVA
ncbi:hypothetical protein TrVE_jg3976 [Triparma verrucosa]|uniref:Histone-lysine N-methyltransferase, H3 lysine-79 specific n=1 Tax=Triparma verrucosa TaxID=1606542 RepID=A0A9W7BGT0_9STRA|nr:hypothetical protein TrVE_jg3976 [Triparma verrucosa]